MTTATTTCPHFGPCGGCSRQNLPYPEQLTNKEKIVRRHLEGLNVGVFHPILQSPDEFFYRNKMEFSFGDEKDLEILARSGGGQVSGAATGEARSGAGYLPAPRTAHLGLHPKGRFALVTPTPECRLLSEDSRKICAVVEKWATENKVPVFVRKSAQGELRHLVIREGKGTGMRMVNLISKSTTRHVDELATRIKESGLPVTTFMWTAYDGLSDVAGGDQRKIYWGDGRIEEKIGGLLFKVNPASFMQTNTHAAEQMINTLRDWIPASSSWHAVSQDPLAPEVKVDPGLRHSRMTTLIDLYCGSGAIGLSLSKEFGRVIGVELNKSAVEDARANAALNGISNAMFMEGKAEDLAASLPVKEDADGTTVVVDPPRAGLHTRLVETLLDWSVPTVFYVSCNPESLARDLRALLGRYDILDAQPMDFFPHTDHIETAVRLRRHSRESGNPGFEHASKEDLRPGFPLSRE